jgi:hypothetical protein
MGASLISTTIRARNINDAWKQVYERAQEYSGHQEGYSGDFNTCTFEKDVTHMLMTKSQEDLDDHITDNCDKREAWGYNNQFPIKIKLNLKLM